MEWISIKERLPEENVYEVLVKVDEPFFGTSTPRMIVAYYSEEFSQWRCELTSKEVYHVTHWMPLPKPPKD